MSQYVRHEPEKTVFYQTIARCWPAISAVHTAASDDGVPEHVESEFKRYLRCGILQYGFVRLKCTACERERVVGFSCKCRGFCASCGAKRMEQSASRLEGEVWPVANARQWVLTFPHQVRHWLSRSPELLCEVISAVTAEISFFYERQTLRGDDAGFDRERATGVVTFVQRFGSSLALNPHLHMIFLDGVFAKTSRGKEFVAYPDFDSSSVIQVLSMIYRRLDKLFRIRGYVREDGEVDELPDLDSEVPLPFRPRAPKAYRRRGAPVPHPLYKISDPDMMSVQGWCNVRWKWFTLHAGVAIKGQDRHGLKQLFRYTSRSSVSPSRVSYADPNSPDDSEIELALKRPWSDGSVALRFSQDDFVERLAALVPPPWTNLVRYGGVFAPGHTWRASIVPGPKSKPRPRCELDEDQDPPRPTKPSAGRAPAEYTIAWAELLRRTYGFDPEVCECGAKMKVEASVTEHDDITAVMTKMGLSSTPPPLGRRPRVRGELDYVFEGE